MMQSDKIIQKVDSVCGDITKLETREKLHALEKIMKALPQTEIPVRHVFSGDIYAREIFIPAGTLLTGRMYLIDHIDMMVFGDMTVSGDDGTKRVTGYNVFPSIAGKKRAGYAHSDTLWITFCKCEVPTEEFYMTKISIENSFAYEQELIKRMIVKEEDIKKAYDSLSNSDIDYNSFKDGYLLASGKISEIEGDRKDFALMCNDIGVSAEEIRAQSEITDNRTDVECEGVYTAKSAINDTGLFTSNKYAAGDEIMLGRIDGLKTIAGRFTNHSITPNAVFKMQGDNVILISTRNIDREEITVDYRESFKLGGNVCQE